METKSNKSTANSITIKLVHSTIGATPKQRKVIKALGFTKINQVKVFPNNDSIKGMINVVSHLVQVEE